MPRRATPLSRAVGLCRRPFGMNETAGSPARPCTGAPFGFKWAACDRERLDSADDARHHRVGRLPMTLPEVLDRLLAMPALLARAAAALVPEARRVRGPGGGSSLVEHACHLADLEREGFGTRITRLLSEPEPRLPDFDGDRVARERSYQDA